MLNQFLKFIFTLKPIPGLRFIVSKEHCYERMNEKLRVRRERLWADSANTIGSLYQIAKAKILMHRYHQHQAARKISLQYRLMKLRVQAKDHLNWLRTKWRARLFHEMRVSKWLLQVWTAWKKFITFERARKASIEQRVERGMTKWITEKVFRLQRLHEIAMTNRRAATEQYAGQLDPVVLHSLEVQSQKVALELQPELTAKRELCAVLYEQLLQEVSTWRAPTPHLIFLAERYTLPLEALPVAKIKSWLKRRRRNVSNSVGFLDLHAPFPIRTLRFLAKVSSCYALQHHVASQSRQIWVHYEAKMVVREYLALLYLNNQVVFSPATTFSPQLRHEAVLILRRKDQEEAMETGSTALFSSPRLPLSLPAPSQPSRHAFTSFHCLWNDLCEKCIMLQSSPVSAGDGHSSVHLRRSCSCCGHRHFEKSTLVNQSYAAFPKIAYKPSQSSPSSAAPTTMSSSTGQQQYRKLFSDSERCDFLVLNTFFQALAPLEHANRTVHAPETLWKLAMAHALGAVTFLYEQLHVASLSSLLHKLKANVSSGEMAEWEGVMPPQVLDKLLLLGTLLHDELLSVEQEVRTHQARLR